MSLNAQEVEMAYIWVAKIRLWIKGHHRYSYKNTVDENLECLRDSENHLIVYSKKTNQLIKIIGHFSDALAKIVDEMMWEWKDL